jgi:hypothetical protein
MEQAAAVVAQLDRQLLLAARVEAELSSLDIQLLLHGNSHQHWQARFMHVIKPAIFKQTTHRECHG